MLKKLAKPKPRQPQASSSPSLVQQQPSRTPTPNPTPSLARQPLAERSATEAASLVADGLATSVGTPTSNTIPSDLETAPTSRSGGKGTAVNALKLLLKIASDIPGPGVKPALAGLLTIIERVQVRCKASDSCGRRSNEATTQETSDNIQGFANLATRMETLRRIFSDVKLMDIEGASAVVGFLQKLETCASLPADIH
jgi:hypothetical protein